MSAQLLSRVQLFETPWTVACQGPLSMGFSRHCYFLLPGFSLTQGSNLHLLCLLPVLGGDFFTTDATWEAPKGEADKMIHLPLWWVLEMERSQRCTVKLELCCLHFQVLAIRRPGNCGGDCWMYGCFISFLWCQPKPNMILWGQAAQITSCKLKHGEFRSRERKPWPRELKRSLLKVQMSPRY